MLFKMNRIWLKKKTFFIAIAVIVVSYFLFRLQKYEHEASIIIPKINPSDAWEFIADFSNMKYLNPTIIDFNILSESGNYENWQYTAEYSEHLSHWPYLFNKAIAHFVIKALPRQNKFYIVSTHNTCMLRGLFCLNTDSQFLFTKHTDGALCIEQIEYQCPSLLSRFCKREIEFQRSAIMSNLKKHFIPQPH